MMPQTGGNCVEDKTSRALLAEDLITKRYRKTIWKDFISALKQYRMTEENDRIAVCVSGGKDSFLLAKCMQLLQKHSDFPFELCFLAMDPGYSPENRRMIMDTAADLNIPLDIFDSEILSVAERSASPCHVCAAMRRGYLYKEAQKRQCNKIALGHHFDDVCETVLLSMLYGGEFKTMMPRLDSVNYAGMQLIRPLYHVREKNIISWTNACGVTAVTCACNVTRREDGGKRKEIKRLLADLEKGNPQVLSNIFASTQAVNLRTVLSYRNGRDEPAISTLDKPHSLDKAT